MYKPINRITVDAEIDFDSIMDDNRDAVIEYASDNLTPEEVFDVNELEAWAFNNGYIKDEGKNNV